MDWYMWWINRLIYMVIFHVGFICHMQVVQDHQGPKDKGKLNQWIGSPSSLMWNAVLKEGLDGVSKCLPFVQYYI